MLHAPGSAVIREEVAMLTRGGNQFMSNLAHCPRSICPAGGLAIDPRICERSTVSVRSRSTQPIGLGGLHSNSRRRLAA